MVEDRRPIYRAFALSFIGISAIFVVLKLLEIIFKFTLFNGNPIPVALLVGGVGVALLWTLKDIDPSHQKVTDELVNPEILTHKDGDSSKAGE
jgi:hypothetical protein